MDNRDSFGLAAREYRAYRPVYPSELFSYLASLCAEHHAALDCATGNGQAAVALAEHFDRVRALDSSAGQIAEAAPHPRVEYRVGRAEDLDAELSFDLITAAQGAHWFDLPVFYAAARRVAKPDAVMAIWGYSFCRVDEAVDAILEHELLGAIAPYWAEGNRVIKDSYRTIPFPFDEIEPPRFLMRHDWNRDAYLAYLRTWSAVARFKAEQGADPVAGLEPSLASVWPRNEPRTVEFELPMRIGRFVL